MSDWRKNVSTYLLRLGVGGQPVGVEFTVVCHDICEEKLAKVVKKYRTEVARKERTRK